MPEQIREIIVVEGLHDKQAVNRAVAADVWVVGGDRIARLMFAELRRAGAVRGIIVLTDPDGPGERIRRRIAEVVPNCQHAFLPREEARSPDGERLGVEFASPDSIVRALANARQDSTLTEIGPEMEMLKGEHPQTQQGPMDLAGRQPFSVADLQLLGLSNHPQAARRRTKLGEALGVGYGNVKSFLQKLNALGVTREEWQRAIEQAFPGERLEICSEKGDEQADGASV